MVFDIFEKFKYRQSDDALCCPLQIDVSEESVEDVSGDSYSNNSSGSSRGRDKCVRTTDGGG